MEEDINNHGSLSTKNENSLEFDYDSLWNKQEEKKDKKLINELPKGLPRKGLKGKWIKRKNHVTRNQVKYSYMRFVKEVKKESLDK